MSPDKGCVGTKQDFLIDDHPEWANAHNFAGQVIKFGAPRDDKFVCARNWKDVIVLFKEMDWRA